ncbi:MAG: polymer-forming cytoskeletal protein [Anaerolineales bacterium]|jgi:hypothetical protein
MKKRLLLVPIVLLVALALPVSALADGYSGGRVIFGDDYTLESGEELDGDLLVFGGNVTLEQGSSVEGSVFVLGGYVRVGGEVEGDVGVLGGNVILGSRSMVDGDVTTLGGNLDRQPGAQVDGEVSSTFGFGFDFEALESIDLSRISWVPRWSPWVGIVWFVFRILMLAALAALVAMLWPQPVERTADAIASQPWLSGGIGLLTIVVTPLLLLLMIITLVLIPVSVATVLLVFVAGVFGWIALGTEIGRRLAGAFKKEWHPAAAGSVGTLLLTFVVGGLGMISCFAKLIPVLVACLGLGAVLLTRFGSRPYVRAETATAAEAKLLEEAEPAPEKKGKKKS